jgi:hypothetical protein
MSIEQQEKIALHKILVTLLRRSGELQAGENAMLQVWLELAQHWGDSKATEILSRYDDYKQKHLVDALLELEKRFPSLAAELDEGRPLISPDDEENLSA